MKIERIDSFPLEDKMIVTFSKVSDASERKAYETLFTEDNVFLFTEEDIVANCLIDFLKNMKTKPKGIKSDKKKKRC